MKKEIKKIIILLGEGKSTLVDCLMRDDNHKYGLVYGITDLIARADQIKKDCYCWHIVVHLHNEEDIKKIPLSIKRRAYLYRIGIIK